MTPSVPESPLSLESNHTKAIPDHPRHECLGRHAHIGSAVDCCSDSRLRHRCASTEYAQTARTCTAIRQQKMIEINRTGQSEQNKDRYQSSLVWVWSGHVWVHDEVLDGLGSRWGGFTMGFSMGCVHDGSHDGLGSRWVGFTMGFTMVWVHDGFTMGWIHDAVRDRVGSRWGFR